MGHGQCLGTNGTLDTHIHTYIQVGPGGVWTSASAGSLVPPTAGLHYTPMHTDFPPSSSGVLPSNYGLSVLSTPLAASQVGDP